MAKPKKPSLLKIPKKPKNKTIANMKKYLSRLDEVSKENNKRLNKYNADLKTYEKLRERIARA
jgi:hypothetical protein